MRRAAAAMWDDRHMSEVRDSQSLHPIGRTYTASIPEVFVVDIAHRNVAPPHQDDALIGTVESTIFDEPAQGSGGTAGI